MRAKIVFSSVFVLPSKTPAGKKGIGIEIEAVRLPPNGGGGGHGSLQHEKVKVWSL